jgi:hypothetical protein
MKKNILAENMKRFGTKNLTEQEYQSLGQKGEIPMLDPEADIAHAENMLAQLEKVYSQVKPKRVDMTEFKNDVRDLISIYKDKPKTDQRSEYLQAFFKLYPIAKTNTAWKGLYSDVTSLLGNLLQHAKSVAQGDTSNYGYRVHAWQRSKGIPFKGI